MSTPAPPHGPGATSGTATAIPVDVGADGSVALPAGVAFDTAAFARVGDDLMLTGPDGTRVVVDGFFGDGPRPDLVSADGARIPGDIAARLAGAAGAGTGSGAVVGRITAAEGTATVLRADGSREPVTGETDLYGGDVLETGPDGSVGVILADETSFSMDSSGRAVLDEAIAGADSVSLFAIGGRFSVVEGTGTIAQPVATVIETPMASIGLASGQIGIDVGGDEGLTVVAVESAEGGAGVAAIGNPAGAFTTGAVFQKIVIGGFDEPPVPFGIVDEDTVVDLFGPTLARLPLTHGRANDYGLQDGLDFDEAAFVTDAGPDTGIEAGPGGPGPVVGGDYTGGRPGGADIDVPSAPGGGAPSGTATARGDARRDANADGQDAAGNLEPGAGELPGGGPAPAGVVPVVSLSGPAAVAEGDAGTAAVTYTVTLDAPSASDVVVRWTADDGSVTIAAGETSATIAIAISGDTAREGGETFSVSIRSAEGAEIGDAATVETTILGDDPDRIAGPEGTGRNDNLRGTEGDEVIAASGGKDRLFGGGGDDDLRGGSGDDRLYGEDGDDVLTGGDGRDELRGGAGDDTFVVSGADDARDRLLGGDGTDRIVAAVDGDITLNRLAKGDSIEVVDGGATESDIRGTGGNDNLDFSQTTFQNIGGIDAGGGKDTVRGTSDGDDDLRGGTGDDRLYGEDGDDVLTGGAGRDDLRGGAGDDTFVVSGADDARDKISGGDGTDRIVSGDDGDITLTRFSKGDSIEVIDGGETESEILGTGGNDNLDFSQTTFENIGVVDAGGGKDTVRGTADGELIDGGAGKDKLYGGGGDDDLRGGTGDDRLYGEDGDDVLTGGAGRDDLRGGAGDDTFIVSGIDDARDKISGGDGFDTILSDGDIYFTGRPDFSDIEAIKIAGEEGRIITGSGLNDALDFLRITMMDGVEAIDAGAGRDTVHGTNLFGDTILGGSGKDRLYGHGGDDVLEGGTGDDRLYGGEGDDVLEGGAGRDLLTGGRGDDTFVFEAGGGSDRVEDFLAGDALLFRGDEFSIDDITIVQKGKDAIITFGGEKSVDVTVRNTDADSLQGYSISEDAGDAVLVTVDTSL